MTSREFNVHLKGNSCLQQLQQGFRYKVTGPSGIPGQCARLLVEVALKPGSVTALTPFPRTVALTVLEAQQSPEHVQNGTVQVADDELQSI